MHYILFVFMQALSSHLWYMAWRGNSTNRMQDDFQDLTLLQLPSCQLFKFILLWSKLVYLLLEYRHERGSVGIKTALLIHVLDCENIGLRSFWAFRKMAMFIKETACEYQVGRYTCLLMAIIVCLFCVKYFIDLVLVENTHFCWLCVIRRVGLDLRMVPEVSNDSMPARK
jgi:hypothetical protein